LRASHPGIHVTLVMPGMVATEFAGNAIGGGVGMAPGTGPGAPPPGVQPQRAEQVAAVIARVIEAPVAEVFTNPVSAEFVRRYYEEIGASEG
ncbi:MAG: hypothetical protein ABJC89_11290, partial [Acidobacteriota bacterium]